MIRPSGRPARNVHHGALRHALLLCVIAALPGPRAQGHLQDATKDLLDDDFPVGTVAIWSGLTTAVPTGWAFCDGSNGTPDLRGRFVMGTGPGEVPGDTGGAVTHVHAGDPHAHTASPPAHTHAVTGASASTSSGGDHGHSTGTASTRQGPNFFNTPNQLTPAWGEHTHSLFTELVSPPSHSHATSIPGQTASAAQPPSSPTSAAGPSTGPASNFPRHVRLAYIMKISAGFLGTRP